MAINDGYCGHCGNGEFQTAGEIITCCRCGAQHAIVATHMVPLPCYPQPIPVSERLPEKDMFVLWWDGYDWQAGSLGFCENGGRPQFDFDAGDPYYTPEYDGYGIVFLKDTVTHWLPMPQPGPPRPAPNHHDSDNPHCVGNKPIEEGCVGFICTCLKPE